MSLTVKELFDSVDKKIMGQVKWNEKINCRLPGVYCVSISSKEDVLETIEEYPVSLNKIEEWIEYVPDMKVDGNRSTVEAVVERLNKFWLPKETILYIGKAGTSLRNRVNQYYTTKLGNRSPHAGGHWLKTLDNLNDLNVFWTTSGDKDAEELEQELLRKFVESINYKNELYDAEHPFPFANLEHPKGKKKRHGISKSVNR